MILWILADLKNRGVKMRAANMWFLAAVILVIAIVFVLMQQDQQNHRDQRNPFSQIESFDSLSDPIILRPEALS